MAFLFVSIGAATSQSLRFSLKESDLTFAENGQQATNLLRSNRYELIIINQDVSQTESIALLNSANQLSWKPWVLWAKATSESCAQIATLIRNWGGKGQMQTLGGSTTLDAEVESLEKRLIQEAMEKTRFNQVRAAKLLGLTRGTLQYKLKKYGIRKATEVAVDFKIAA